MFKGLLLTLSLILLLTGCINNDGYTRSNEGLSWTIDSGSDGTPDYISKKDIPEGLLKLKMICIMCQSKRTIEGV